MVFKVLEWCLKNGKINLPNGAKLTDCKLEMGVIENNVVSVWFRKQIVGCSIAFVVKEQWKGLLRSIEGGTGGEAWSIQPILHCVSEVISIRVGNAALCFGPRSLDWCAGASLLKQPFSVLPCCDFPLAALFFPQTSIWDVVFTLWPLCKLFTSLLQQADKLI